MSTHTLSLLLIMTLSLSIGCDEDAPPLAEGGGDEINAGVSSLAEPSLTGVTQHEDPGDGDVRRGGEDQMGGVPQMDAGESAGISGEGGDQAGEDAGADGIGGGGVDDLAGEEIIGGVESMGGSEPSELEPRCGSTRDRALTLLALTFPYTDEIGVNGEAVALYFTGPNGALSPFGERLMMGYRPKALSFSHDGEWLVVLGEEGEMTSVDLRGEQPTLSHRLDLPSGVYRHLSIHPRSRRFETANGNSTDEGGVYTLELDCEGALSLAYDPFLLRLTYGVSRASSAPHRAVVLGGQAIFDPIDDLDVRLLVEGDLGWTQVLGADIFTDFIDANHLAFSASGQRVGLVNGSPFSLEGGQVRILGADFNPPSVVELARFEDVTDARRARFTSDEQRLVVSQFEPGKVQLFDYNGAMWTRGETLSRLGLADDFVLSAPPAWATPDQGAEEEDVMWLWVPATAPQGGSAVHTFVLYPDAPTRALSSSSLSDGASNLPGGIAVWPLRAAPKSN